MIKKWVIRFVIGIVALVIVTVAYFGYIQPWIYGLELRHSILKEIDTAKKIQVVEHSSRWDNVSMPTNWKETVYATLTLTPTQISQLRTTLSPARDYSANEVKACIFEPHHRFEMFEPDGHVYSIEICFVCAQLAINGEDARIFPVGWDSRVKAFISSLALHPDGPWQRNNN